MPSWAIHLAVSEELSKNMNQKEKEAFTFGNLLPDVNNSFLIPNVSKIIPHDITHYNFGHHYQDAEEIKKILVDYKKLYEQLGEKLKEPMMYGYFTHLLTDYYWNHHTYIKKGVFDNNKIIGIYKNDNSIFYGDDEQRRVVKVEDFNRFSKYLYQNSLPKIHFEDETLLEQAKKIPIISLEESDITKINEYFEQLEPKLNQIEGEYEIYTLEEFKGCLKENVDFIRKILFSQSKASEQNKNMFKINKI